MCLANNTMNMVTTSPHTTISQFPFSPDEEEELYLPTTTRSSRLLAIPSISNNCGPVSLSKTDITGTGNESSGVSTVSLGGSSGEEYSDGESNDTTKKTNKSTNKESKQVTSGGKKKKGSLTTKGYQRHFAVHNYTDYSHVRPTQEDLRNGTSISKGGVHNPFPAVLHRMMEDLEGKTTSSFCSWQPHGRAFLIKDPKHFMSDVLPLYFKHSKLSSFQRQLSLYGFIRLTGDGPDRGAYYHPYFLRGRPFLCSKIQRTRVKGTWVRTSSSPESEPNFYHMEPVRDITMSGPSADKFADEDSSLVSSLDDCDREGGREDRMSQKYANMEVFDLPTINNKNKVQITFDLPDTHISNSSMLLPPPTLPRVAMSRTSVPTTTTTLKAKTTEHYQQYMTFSRAIMESDTAVFSPVPSPEDMELATFLSDIDLDLDFLAL